MRRFPLVAAFAFVVSAAGGALAHPFTEHFLDLEAELVQRRDNDYPEPLDRTAKKELKAIVKSLLFLGKEADDLGDDLKTAGKVAKALEKGFPEEFAEEEGGGIEIVAPFPGVLDLALDNLQLDVEAALVALEERVPGLNPKAAIGAGKAVLAALDALDAETTTRSARAKSLVKAFKAVVRGNRIADKNAGGPGGGGGGGGGLNITLTIGGVSKSVDAASALYVSAIGAISISLTDTGPPLSGAGVTATIAGSGSYTPAGGSAVVGSDIYAAIGTGNLTITTFDLGNTRIGGSFTFTASGQGETVGDVEVVCTFDITNMIIM
ncbi:MAG TPA: hypothetical protein VFS92_10295 [Planctomycetota bacterium]|nr:hypothetical protein [Planctomycetota bacterium]